MAERNQQSVPEIVSKWVKAISETKGNPAKKQFTPDALQQRIKELGADKPITTGETRSERDQREAKKFVDEVQANQDHITSEMKKWNEANKYKGSDLLPLDQAKKKLQTALDLSKHKPAWSGITSGDQITHSAAAAEYLSRVASLPEELANDPNVFFQETAKFAASMSKAPEARVEEIKILNQAILHMRELRDTNKIAGFTLNNEDLTYTLRGCVLYDETLDPTPEKHTKLFLAKLQKEIDNRGKISTEQELREFQDVGRLLTKAISVELDEDGNKKTFEVDIKGLKKYIDRANRRAGELKQEYKQEDQKERMSRTAHVTYEDIRKCIPEEERTHDPERRGETLQLHYFSEEQIRTVIEKGEEGLDSIFYEFIEEIDGMGKQHERPDIPEMSFHHDFMELVKFIYKDNQKAHLAPYEYVWKEHDRLSMIIKNLLFQPGDIKDKLKNLQFLTPNDINHFVKNYRFSGDATQLYEEVVFDLLSERRAAYDEAYNFLTTKPSLDGIEPIREYEDLIKWRNSGSPMANEQDGLNKTKRLNELQEKIDILGSGVMLWDSDIQTNTELTFEIGGMDKELKRLTTRVEAGETLSDYEKDQCETLKKQIEHKRSILEQKPERSGIQELNKEFHESSDLSPVDIEVRSRLQALLKSRGIKDVPEWQLRRAIWAARQEIIGTARIMSIGSSVVTRPAYELKDMYKEVKWGKYVMRAPAFEDLQRVINPDMFQDRFGISSEAGNIFRAKTSIGFLEQKGFKYGNDARYKRDVEKELDPEIRKSREFLRQVREETGIPYTESITQGIFKGGGILDMSLWRSELAIIDKIRENLMSQGLPENAQLENQALGIRLALESKPAAKKVLIERMIERNPGKLLQLLGTPADKIFRDHNFLPENKNILRRALSLSTVRLSQETAYKTRVIHLMTNEADFNQILRPLLIQEGMSDVNATESFKILKDMKTAFTKERTGHQYESLMDAWANFDWPLTVSTSDFDWKDVDFLTIGTIGIDRRGRDLFQMAMARDQWGLLETPAVLFGKDIKETLKVIAEFRKLMNQHTDPVAAERATYELVSAWIDMNINKRTKNWWDPTCWVPLADVVLKNVGHIDWHNEKINTFMKNKVTGGFSYAARFTGPTGNAFEEKQLDEIIDALLGAGIFNTNEHSYEKLRKQKRAGFPRQVLGLIRKNWWIIPLVTILMASKSSLDDEKKKQ